MNSRLIFASSFMVLVALLASSACMGQVPLSAQSKSGHVPKRYASYVGLIKSAIQDEMAVATPIDVARRYGVESAGQVTLDLEALIAPFALNARGFSTHVIYLVPGFGYVIRQVTVYPEKRLALFWLGYSTLGPGFDTGFNCTHSKSNCKIQDIPFRDLRSAFCSWWLVPMKVGIGNPGVVERAKRRNAERAKLIEQSQSAALR